MKNISILKIMMAIAVCGSGSAHAVPIFDFESQATGFFSSVSATNDGLTVTVTPEGFPDGFVRVATGFLTEGLGLVSLMGTQVQPAVFGGWAPLRFTFDQPVSFIEFLFGDGGGGASDEDSPVIIEGFDIGGISLGALTGGYPLNQGSALSLSGGFAGASYFIASSGSLIGNPHSIHWEISEADTAPRVSVPSPATLALFGLGLTGLGWSRRKQHS